MTDGTVEGTIDREEFGVGSHFGDGHFVGVAGGEAEAAAEIGIFEGVGEVGGFPFFEVFELCVVECWCVMEWNHDDVSAAMRRKEGGISNGQYKANYEYMRRQNHLCIRLVFLYTNVILHGKKARS